MSNALSLFSKNDARQSFESSSMDQKGKSSASGGNVLATASVAGTLLFVLTASVPSLSIVAPNEGFNNSSSFTRTFDCASQSSGSVSVDLSMEENRRIIREMASYPDDWNGYGAKSFPDKAVKRFDDIIKKLRRQPCLMPTARNSILLQYDAPDKTQLVFEVFFDHAEEVIVPGGDYSRMQSTFIWSDIAEYVNNAIGDIDGFGIHC